MWSQTTIVTDVTYNSSRSYDGKISLKWSVRPRVTEAFLGHLNTRNAADCQCVNGHDTYVDAEIVEKLQRRQICTSQTTDAVDYSISADISIRKDERDLWSKVDQYASSALSTDHSCWEPIHQCEQSFKFVAVCTTCHSLLLLGPFHIAKLLSKVTIKSRA